jgi:hypothetical protein
MLRETLYTCIVLAHVRTYVSRILIAVVCTYTYRYVVVYMYVNNDDVQFLLESNFMMNIHTNKYYIIIIIIYDYMTVYVVCIELYCRRIIALPK